ncbi:MAG: F0F1 ATP synthase subunit gamma [Rhodospirillales bacterium]|nr:F0F1 ATP synthase subunit gamma [Rhodospirillales bacterium]
MANLKELKTRISSVKSTQKITSAMKMVAASRLKRAQEAAEAARPYAERMERMMTSLLDNPGSLEGAGKLLSGTGSDDTHLIVVVTSDRGLCGGFNANISRGTRNRLLALTGENKNAKILCIGRKGREQLKTEFKNAIVDTYEGIGKAGVQFEEAQGVAVKIIEIFEAGEFDVCSIIYNKFISAITQEVTLRQIIPVQLADEDDEAETAVETGPSAIYEFEPSEEEILAKLLPSNLNVQVFRALLESSASEHGARMSAMDNATRNAGEMIDDLSITYNRTRQAKITSELIEIISGAEAL